MLLPQNTAVKVAEVCEPAEHIAYCSSIRHSLWAPLYATRCGAVWLVDFRRRLLLVKVQHWSVVDAEFRQQQGLRRRLTFSGVKTERRRDISLAA